MPKLDNYMTRDYDTMRIIIRIVGEYGCYTAKQICQKFGISEYKYKENILRLFLVAGKEHVKELKNGKSKILSLNTSIYDNMNNFLLKSFKMKCGTVSSMDYYLMIMQIMSDGVERSASAICEEINRNDDDSDGENKNYDNILVIDKGKRTMNIEKIYMYMKVLGLLEKENVLNNKTKIKVVDEDIVKGIKATQIYVYLDNLLKLGIIKSTGIKKKTNYSMAVRREKINSYYELVPMHNEIESRYFIIDDVFEKIKNNICDNNRFINILLELKCILDIMIGGFPLKSIGYMLQSSISDILYRENSGKFYVKDILIYKNCFWGTALDDEVVLHLLYAWETKMPVSFTYVHEKGEKEQVVGLVNYLFTNDYGIQYVSINSDNSILTYRIDMIYNITIKSSTSNSKKSKVEKLKLFHELKNIRCAFMNNISHIIKNDGRISQDDLQREYKRCIPETDGPVKRYCEELFKTIVCEKTSESLDDNMNFLMRNEDGSFTTTVRKLHNGKKYPVVIPIIFTEYEKRYLKTLMLTSQFNKLASDELKLALSDVFYDVLPFNWEKFIKYRYSKNTNKNMDILECIDDVIINKLKIITKKIELNLSMHCLYEKKNIEVYPYKIVMSEMNKNIQLLAVSANRENIIIMNLDEIYDIKDGKNHKYEEEYFHKILEMEKVGHMEITLHEADNSSDQIEYVFRVLSNYNRNTFYDDEKGIYYWKIAYHAFEKKEINTKLNSLNNLVNDFEWRYCI